jgi:hypothetical protein
MNKLLKTLAVIFAVSLAVICCKKDDDKSNYIKAGDKKFTAASGVLYNFYFAASTEGCYYGLTLVSPDVTVGEYGSLDGAGKIIRFYLVSTSLVGLASGEYEFNEDTLPFNSFGNASYCLEWESGALYPIVGIVSGVLYIRNNEGIYEITIDCKDENGDDVKGYFKGRLLCVDGQLTK